MKKLIALCFSICALGLVGCSNNNSDTTSGKESTIAYNQAVMSHYDVAKRDQKIKLDGELTDEIWEEIPSINGGFHFPWENKEAPNTVFKAYYDEKNMYFSFDVTDQDVVVAEPKKEGDESVVDLEDRVEIFFGGKYIDVPGPKGMEPYYGLEIDPKGRVHDYSIIYYRDFDSDWNLEGLQTKATQTKKGYSVEGIIPMQYLKDKKLIRENNVMNVGVYRAEFSTSEKGKEPVMEWISWVDPKTENPDFHVASSFGEFRFLK